MMPTSHCDACNGTGDRFVVSDNGPNPSETYDGDCLDCDGTGVDEEELERLCGVSADALDAARDDEKDARVQG